MRRFFFGDPSPAKPWSASHYTDRRSPRTDISSPSSSEQESLRSEYVEDSQYETPPLSAPSLFHPQEDYDSDANSPPSHHSQLSYADSADFVLDTEPRRVRHAREDLLNGLIAIFSIVNDIQRGLGPYQVLGRYENAHRVKADSWRRVNGMMQDPWKGLSKAVQNIVKCMKDKRVMRNRYIAAGLAVLLHFADVVCKIKTTDKRYTQGLQRGEYQTIQPVLRQLEELREVMKGFEDPFKMGTERAVLSSTSPILLCRAALLTLSASDNQPLPNFDLSELPFDEPRFVLSHTNIRLLLMTFGVQPPDLVTYISLRGNRLHAFPTWKPFPFPALESIDLSDNSDLKHLPIIFTQLGSLDHIGTHQTELVTRGRRRTSRKEFLDPYPERTAYRAISPTINSPQEPAVELFGSGIGRRESWSAAEFSEAYSRSSSSRESAMASRRASRRVSRATSPSKQRDPSKTQKEEMKLGPKGLVDYAIASIVKYRARLSEGENVSVVPSDPFPGNTLVDTFPAGQPRFDQPLTSVPLLFDSSHLPPHLKDQLEKTFLCESCRLPKMHLDQARDLPGEAGRAGGKFRWNKRTMVFAWDMQDTRGGATHRDVFGRLVKKIKIRAILCEPCKAVFEPDEGDGW